MDTTDIKSIWQTYDAKLEKSLKLNLHCLQTIQSHKVNSSFTTLTLFKIVETILSVLLFVFLGNFLYQNLVQVYFVLSAAILMAFCMLSMIGSINQLYQIQQIDITQNIIDNQRKMALLQSVILFQSSIIKYLRMGFLSLPFYTAYIIIGCKIFFNFDIVLHGGKYWWLSQIAISILFIPLSIWLYKKIAYKNMHINWVRKLIEQAGGKSISKVLHFIKELDEFEKDIHG